MFREGTVKYKAILPRCQRHGRFLRHFGLQLPHLGRGQVGRVGHDEVQLPFRQSLPIGEQISLHRGQMQPIGQAGIPGQIRKRRRAFFQARHLCRRAEPLDAQAQTAGPGAEIQHLRVLDAPQQFGGGLGHHFGIGTGAEHTGPHRQLKVEERPAAAEVLQRLTVGTAGGQGFQLRRLCGGQRSRGQPGVCAHRQPEEFSRVKIGIGAARLGEPGLHLPQRRAGQDAFVHHLPSSGSSGSTGVTAAMATSIMLSSGSNTVRCCTQMPGCRMMRVARLSDRPHHFSSS